MSLFLFLSSQTHEKGLVTKGHVTKGHIIMQTHLNLFLSGLYTSVHQFLTVIPSCFLSCNYYPNTMSQCFFKRFVTHGTHPLLKLLIVFFGSKW